MEPNFCMENGLKTMETMDSMINIGGYGIWEWGTSWETSSHEAFYQKTVCIDFYRTFGRHIDALLDD